MENEQKIKKSKAEGLIPSNIDLSSLFVAKTDKEKLRDKLVGIARNQIKTSMDYKRQRMDDVQKSIDLYNGKTKKALKGRWNVPLPIMSGYIDTLLSKTDDTPKVKFGYKDIADLRRAMKVQAKFDQDNGSVKSRWAEKDRMGKKLASFYGYAVYKIFAYNDAKGVYQSHLEVVDPIDFECEPMGGQNLDDHKFKGQRNIFKTKSEIEALSVGDNPIYDKKQVLRLFSTLSGDENKTLEKLYQEKTDRLKSLGFNPDNYSYMGIKTYAMTEWYMEYDGKWYYLFFEPHSGICIRFEELKDVFESGTDPFEAWHTHPDPFNFYSKAPADDMKPVAEGMNIIFNQALDNREKKNYGQRAYDPSIFTDPSQLEWRPDGLVQAETNNGVRSIGSGIYEFQIPDMPESGTINLMNFMDNIAGLKTGVTASAQGESDNKLVGIYYGNLQQVADRLGLYNKAYSECWGRMGLKYYWGLREHIKSNKMMVKMVGVSGYTWEELVKDDLSPIEEFNIEIVGGQAEVAQDEILKKTKSESLAVAFKLGKINADIATEEILRNGGWEDSQIKRLMDLNAFGSDEIISEANQAIEDIINGENPKLNRGATTLFMQTIIDYAYDTENLPLDLFQQLVDYANAHYEIAIENMLRKVRTAQAVQGAISGGLGMGQVPAEKTLPGSPVPENNLDYNKEIGLTPKESMQKITSSIRL